MFKKKSLWKDIWKEIYLSMGRFLSILALIFLGIAFFVGLKAVGPDMLSTANNYYHEYNLADIEVQSTYGLNKEDVAVLTKTPSLDKIEFGYTADALLKGDNYVLKVFSLPDDYDSSINKYKVIKGRLPQKSGEVAIDENLLFSKKFQIGDIVEFVQNDGSTFTDTFHQTSFKIVGIVSSPKYIEKGKRGTSKFGNGEADGFVVIPENDFNMDVYTVASLLFQNTKNHDAYSADYKKANKQNITTLEKILKDQPELRLNEIKEDAQKEINKATKKIKDGRNEIASQEKKLLNAKKELKKAKVAYENGKQTLSSELDKGEQKLAAAKSQLDNAKVKLQQGQLQITEGKKQLQEAKKQISSGLKQITDAEKQLSQKKTELEQAGMLVGEVLAQIEAQEKELAAKKAELTKSQSTLAKKERALNNSEQKLMTKKKEYQNGVTQYEKGKTQLASSKEAGLAQLNEAKKQLDSGQKTFDTNYKLFVDEKVKAEKKLIKAEADLLKAKKDLKDLALPKYYVLDRSNHPGYLEYEDNADRLTSISSVFPVLFFLIAVLVCLTTMTRMVEEQRTQIGVLKALGYSNNDIIAKFLVYGSLASIVGSIAGLAVGFEVFPRIIFNAYSSLYDLPNLEVYYYPKYILLSIFIGLLCTSFTAVITTRAELRANAATLMRPKAPKNGQRILLERIHFIWNSLNFTSKVTARNIFRYKKRMFMTVIGVAGCTALIFTGFGLRNSINDIVPIQYEQILKYNALVVRDVNASSSIQKEYESLIKETKNIVAHTSLAQKNVTAFHEGVNNQNVTIVVPKNIGEFEQFTNLRDRKTKQKQKITSEGAVITEKLAKIFNLKKGDYFTVRNVDNDVFKVKVTGITEMYAGHYVYMDKNYFEKTFKEDISYNTDYLKFKDTSKKWQNEFAEKIMKNSSVVTISYANTVINMLNDTMGTLNIVVVILIVSAALLAFIVLYNLSNINVSERIRELSTIKVLGFYPNEVTMYVYRENIFLTLIGIVVGYVLGIFLHSFVITTAELDQMMMSPAIHWTSYLFSGVLTLFFSTIVMAVMHFKLKRIDMIEALKSVE